MFSPEFISESEMLIYFRFITQKAKYFFVWILIINQLWKSKIQDHKILYRGKVQYFLSESEILDSRCPEKSSHHSDGPVW